MEILAATKVPLTYMGYAFFGVGIMCFAGLWIHGIVWAADSKFLKDCNKDLVDSSYGSALRSALICFTIFASILAVIAIVYGILTLLSINLPDIVNKILYILAAVFFVITFGIEIIVLTQATDEKADAISAELGEWAGKCTKASKADKCKYTVEDLEKYYDIELAGINYPEWVITKPARYHKQLIKYGLRMLWFGSVACAIATLK